MHKRVAEENEKFNTKKEVAYIEKKVK